MVTCLRPLNSFVGSRTDLRRTSPPFRAIPKSRSFRGTERQPAKAHEFASATKEQQAYSFHPDIILHNPGNAQPPRRSSMNHVSRTPPHMTRRPSARRDAHLSSNGAPGVASACHVLSLRAKCHDLYREHQRKLARRRRRLNRRVAARMRLAGQKARTEEVDKGTSFISEASRRGSDACRAEGSNEERRHRDTFSKANSK